MQGLCSTIQTASQLISELASYEARSLNSDALEALKLGSHS